MSNAKEFEPARLSPTLNPRHSGKTVSNTRLSKAAMGAEGCPYTRDLLWSRAKESPGWWCCVKAGGLDVLPAQQPTSLFPWLGWKFLPLLTHSIFSPTFDEIPIWNVASVSHRLLSSEKKVLENIQTT